ncbi:MAG: hypothetical protein ACFFCT_14250 [Candidatus Odinarchaeota archaeon]
MPGKWWPIAKAEFLVRTVKLHVARKILYPALIGISLLFVLFATPRIIGFFLGEFGVGFEILLATSLPGLMRTFILVIWLMILVLPMSNSLENTKTDQWEIMFSRNVKTRDILFGTYLGKIPVYGLVALILSSIVVAPFAYVYNVSIPGQLLMYLVLIIFAITTLWISNVLTTAIQSKIGQSPRGDDIAKALSWAMVPIIMIPAMGSLYWTNQLVSLLGLEVSMILPSTWVADLLSWIAVTTSTTLPPSSILNINNYWFQISPLISLVLVSGFTVAVYYFGFKSADSIFTLGSGLGSKKVITVGKENFAIRGVRKVFGATFGVIMATSLKDYTRKLQNVAKISYAVFLSLLIPLLLAFGPLTTIVNDPIFIPIMTCLMLGMMLGVFGGIVFGGIGLLDSRSQLWILKSAPRGVPKFIAARVFSYMMLGSIIAIIPAMFSGILLQFTPILMVTIVLYVYSIIVSGIFIGVGITAFNPSYDDSSSSAFVINTIATIFITMIALMSGLIPGIITAINSGTIAPALVIAAVPAPIVGLIILFAGTIKLTISEVV